jgi:hypothetical protein
LQERRRRKRDCLYAMVVVAGYSVFIYGSLVLRAFRGGCDEERRFSEKY